MGYRNAGLTQALFQVIRQIDNLEIKLESFVRLDEFRQLVEREEDAIHHDPAVGNVPAQSVVSEGYPVAIFLPFPFVVLAGPVILLRQWLGIEFLPGVE